MTDLFDFKAPPRHYAVMGNPVEHSQSPRIHRLFARQFGIQLEYDRIRVDAGGFEQAASHFAAHGGAGLNVTLPFKVNAWRLCVRPGNRLSARARRAEAVNTLRFDAGQGVDHAARAVFGDNTDGMGMVRDIENNRRLSITGKRVLLLGAGGAARGVLGPLAECRPASLTIANRTAATARALAEKFNSEPVNATQGGAGNERTARMHGCGFERLDGPAFDLIINATSASLSGQAPTIAPACIGARSLAYDMMYAPAPTVFMQWAAANGACQISDGLGMLVEQAAESFHVWHRRRPDTGPVIKALRDVATGVVHGNHF